MEDNTSNILSRLDYIEKTIKLIVDDLHSKGFALEIRYTTSKENKENIESFIDWYLQKDSCL